MGGEGGFASFCQACSCCCPMAQRSISCRSVCVRATYLLNACVKILATSDYTVWCCLRMILVSASCLACISVCYTERTGRGLEASWNTPEVHQQIGAQAFHACPGAKLVVSSMVVRARRGQHVWRSEAWKLCCTEWRQALAGMAAHTRLPHAHSMNGEMMGGRRSTLKAVLLWALLHV